MFTWDHFFALFAVGAMATILWQERKHLSESIQAYRAIPGRVFFYGLLLAVSTIVLATALYRISPIFLLWGWLTFLQNHSTDTVTSTFTVAAHPGVGNAVLLLAVTFIILLSLVMPFLARQEEKLFRVGIVTWRGMAWNSLKFGMMHCLLGIPLIFGLALCYPGFVFAIQYRNAHLAVLARGGSTEMAIKAGFDASTHIHIAYNLTLLSILAVVVTIAVIGR